MGCDIHLYIEHKNRAGNWTCLGNEINPGRLYGLFAAMAGVRDSWGIKKFKPRGIPEPCSFEVEQGAHMSIRENLTEWYGEDGRSISPERAKYMVEKGFAKPHPTKEWYITNSSWHSHSWLTADEIDECMTSLNIPEIDEEWFVEYRAVVAAMRALEKAGHETRAVFWFDN